MNPAAGQRFLGYAFSVGDAFLELDCDGIIRSFEGAASWLGANESEELTGRSIFDLVEEDDAIVVRCSLRVLRQSRRLGPIRLSCGLRPGSRRSVGLYLASLPEDDGENERVYAVLVALGRLRMLPAASDGADTPSMDVESFLSRLKDLSLEEGSGRPLMITLLRVDEERLPGDRQAFARQLAALSVDGQAAARLGEGRYALLHEAGDGERSADLLKETLSEATGQMFHSATMPVSEMELSDADAARAVVYSIRQFADESAEPDLQSLSLHYREEMARTRSRILEFRNILQQRRFTLAYQPVVRLADRSLHHVEALARFDSRRGSTGEMIAFAEDIGLIVEFDLAVLSKVTAMLARPPGELSSTIAVNISGRSLSSPAFTSALDSLLGRSTRFGGRLLFELTESARIADLTVVNDVLLRVRQAGHPVCLDDFGAGLAGYQYLRHLEVDYVKLDGSYIQRALTDLKTRAFLHSMVTLCQDLGIATIAECVETEEEAGLVKELGVDMGQGYLFGAPHHQLPKTMRGEVPVRTMTARG